MFLNYYSVGEGETWENELGGWMGGWVDYVTIKTKRGRHIILLDIGTIKGTFRKIETNKK